MSMHPEIRIALETIQFAGSDITAQAKFVEVGWLTAAEKEMFDDVETEASHINRLKANVEASIENMQQALRILDAHTR